MILYMENIQLINCDWLQFHGEHLGLQCGVSDKGTKFILKDVGKGTRVFKNVFQVWEKASVTKSHRNELFATIALNPHSSALRPNLFVCKLENKVLYQELPYGRTMDMLKQLNLQYQGITRCDLCVDLFQFANGWHPLYLLKEYRKNHIVKHGSRRYSQWMTAPFVPSDLSGEVTHDLMSAEHITHCVTWGGGQSDVHVKMYNKTKEIRESSDKRYIQAWWRANELVGNGDVWRVEISFQRRSKYLMDDSSGDIVPISLELALKHSFQREVFAALAKRHFNFRQLELGKSARSAKEIQLFNLEDCNVMHTAAPESKPIASRTARVCANYIEKICSTTEFDKLLASPDYSKYTLEAAHKTLRELYEGLKTFDNGHRYVTDVQRREIVEKRDWLAAWKYFPETIDGVPWPNIDEILTREECRIRMMEELRIKEIELRVAIENGALSDLL